MWGSLEAHTSRGEGLVSHLTLSSARLWLQTKCGAMSSLCSHKLCCEPTSPISLGLSSPFQTGSVFAHRTLPALPSSLKVLSAPRLNLETAWKPRANYSPKTLLRKFQKWIPLGHFNFSDSTRNEGHKLGHGKFQLGITQHISPYGWFSPGTGPQESPSLEILNTQLDKALSNPIKLQICANQTPKFFGA